MKINELTNVNESVSDGSQIIELLQQIGEEMQDNGDGWGLTFDEKYGQIREFNAAAAGLEAVRLYKMVSNSSTRKTGHNVRRCLNSLAAMTMDGTLKTASEAAYTVDASGFVFEPHVMAAFKAAKQLWSQAEAMEAYVTNVDRIISFLANMNGMRSTSPSYPFVNAALKKLGLR